MPLYEITLKELRKRARLTLVELAERTGVSKSALSKIETGESVPRIDTIVLLVIFFKCELADLVVIHK